MPQPHHAGALSVFQAQGAGRWFPGDGHTLAALVDQCLAAADPAAHAPPPAGIVGLIVPHAGYAYSGPIAAQAYRALEEDARSHPPDAVVVLGFSHRESFAGLALLDADALRTPLGDARLDRDAIRWLTAQGPVFHASPDPHRGEHSAENQVPFLQRVLPGVPLVMALFGRQDAATVAGALAGLEALGRLRRLVLVASTDLLHHADDRLVARTDADTLECLRAMDAPGLMRRWTPEHQVCCGPGPVQTVMAWSAARGCRAGRVLGYCHSGDIEPACRGHWVVGYGAVAYAVPGTAPAV